MITPEARGAGRTATMRCRLLSCFALLWAASPASARADDLTAMISNDGLAFVAQEIPKLLPSSLTVGDLGTSSFLNCPIGGDSELTLSAVQVTKLKLDGTPSLVSSTGKLTASIKLDVEGTFKSHLTKVACVSGTIDCPGAFTAANVPVTLALKPALSGGSLSVSVTSLSVGLTKSNFNVTMNCGAQGYIIDGIIDVFEGKVVSKLKGEIDKAVRAEIPAAVEQALAGMTQLGGSAQGMSFSASLKSVAAKSDGFQVGADITVKATSTPSCTLGSAQQVSGGAASSSFLWQGEHLAASLPRATMDRAVKAAWESGLFCLSDARLKMMGLPAGAATLLGIALGMTVVDELSVNVVDQPSLTLTPGAGAGVKIVAPRTELVFAGQGPKGPATVTARMVVTVAAEVRLNPISRAVELALQSFDVSDIKLSADNPTGLNLDPSVVGTLVGDLVAPLITERLSSMKLAATVLHKSGGVLDPYYLYVARSVTSTDYVKVYLKAFAKPASDSVAPSTTLQTKPDPVTRPQLFRFEASGSDAKTPNELMRFKWRVDGGSWSAASYSGVKLVELEAGAHTVEVQAVDLSYNVDATPAKASFEVDGSAPTLTVQVAPQGVVTTSSVQLVWQVSDDRAAEAEIAVKWDIKRVNTQTGEEQVVQEQPFAPGVTQTEIGGIYNGDYVVTLNARDVAGNLSKPQRVEFTVQNGITEAPPPPPDPEDDPSVSSSGCTAAGASPARFPLLLLLLVCLPLLVRRR